jgi:hypothetical protein
MFGSSILDVAAGIVFVFLLLSLIASTVNELLLSLVNMRARFLVKGLKELLNSSDGKGLMEQLFNHGLIFGLFQGNYKPGKASNLPSYIPARSFALAMMDLVPRYVNQLPAPNPNSNGSEAKSGAHGATSPQTAGDTALNPLKPFRDSVSLLPDSKIREPLIAMIDAANKDASVLLRNIEDWYNSSMERVSGWYKFHTQWIIFFIGIVMSLAVNVDTLVIAKHLSSDATLRQSLAAAAQATAQKPIDDLQKQSFQDQTKRIQDLGLPIGWLNPGNMDAQQEKEAKAEWRIFVRKDLDKIVEFHFWGWLLTALAVSLGAPFWFDVLNKIITVRSTVKPREKGQEEKSKDPQAGRQALNTQQSPA